MAADGDWTIVLPRHRRRKPPRNPKPQIQIQIQALPESKPWAPVASQTDDPQSQSKLMKKMELTLAKVESSDFYRTVTAQIQTPKLASSFSRVLSSQASAPLQLQMVIYGIGSISSYEPPRQQLSLAILLARRFDWIGAIEIFDPIISETESRVMEALGCTVLTVDEEGRREAEKPMLFFMPHCEAALYDHLLEANLGAGRLSRMVVFGNSFQCYERFVSEFASSPVAESSKFVLLASKFAEEFPIETVSEEFFRAFHDTSWHFFDTQHDFEVESVWNGEKEIRTPVAGIFPGIPL